MSQSGFLNLSFALLFIVGITLIESFPSPVKGCGGDHPCFVDFRCNGTEGTCIATEFSCGGNCTSCTDRVCTCYFYEGHCAKAFVIVDGVPQYSYCAKTCCSYIEFCYI